MVKSLSETDVFICGGGPAGLAAAIELRRRRFAVTLADWATPPIDKACGEGLMPDSLAALRNLGVSLTGCATAEFRGIRFLGPHHHASADFPSGRGLGIRRTVLHRVLLQRAQELGVNLLWGTRVTGIAGHTVILDGAHVRCRWIVGADGHNSQVRKWASLEAAHSHLQRIGVRRHFAIRPWSEYVDICWGPHSQMYVTPIAPGEICVALISRKRYPGFEVALDEFPALKARVAEAKAVTSAKGAPTVTRTLRRVAVDNIALIGEASGSSDAITGSGLAMGFRQAIALADAIQRADLSHYQREHSRITALPRIMARAMLLMDGSDWVRTRALRAFHSKPHLFEQLLSLHVGAVSLSSFGMGGALNLGWELLRAGS